MSRLPRFNRGLMSRPALVSVTAVAALLLSMSTSVAHAATNPTFILLQTNGTQSYFVDEGKGAIAEGKKLGATVIVQDENNNDATTVSLLQAGIAAGYQGAMIVAPDAAIGPRLVDIAKTAKIAISSVDNGFAGSDGVSVPAAGFDAAKFGAVSGKLLASYFRKSHWKVATTYAVLNVIPALPTCNLRTDAEKAALKAAGLPASHILAVPYDGTTEAGLKNMAPVQTAHPKAQAWLLSGCNDDGVLGAAKALTSHGVKVSNIIGVGLGGDLACTMWAKGAPNVGIKASTYVDPGVIGAAAVKAMYDSVVNGKAFPAQTLLPPVTVTPANYLTVIKGC